MHTGFNNT